MSSKPTEPSAVPAKQIASVLSTISDDRSGGSEFERHKRLFVALSKKDDDNEATEYHEPRQPFEDRPSPLKFGYQTASDEALEVVPLSARFAEMQTETEQQLRRLGNSSAPDLLSSMTLEREPPLEGQYREPSVAMSSGYSWGIGRPLAPVMSRAQGYNANDMMSPRTYPRQGLSSKEQRLNGKPLSLSSEERMRSPARGTATSLGEERMVPQPIDINSPGDWSQHRVRNVKESSTLGDTSLVSSDLEDYGPGEPHNEHTPGSSRIPTDIFGPNGSFSLMAKVLRLPGEAARDFGAFQAYIHDLQERTKASNAPELPRGQYIHRVTSGEYCPMYLDRPQWLRGIEYAKEALAGNLPILDVRSYLDKHPEVCFIVYRDYELQDHSSDSPREDASGTVPWPQHRFETIQPTTRELATAVSRFLKYHNYEASATDDRDDSGDSDSSGLLEAPYLPFYHSRGCSMVAFLKTLSPGEYEQFRLLVDHIMRAYGHQYEGVDEMISRGKIIRANLKYLFKPGDVVVAGKQQNARGYLCRSWPYGHPQRSSESDRPSGRDSNTTSTKFDTWCWEFDGVFSRNVETLKLDIDAKDHSEKKIDELDIRPLSHVEEELAQTLKRRGEWIWRCRVRQLVSLHMHSGPGLRDTGNERYMIDMSMYRELHMKSPANRLYWDDTPAENSLSTEAMEQDAPPDGTFVYLMPPSIKGFNLKTKKWLDLPVDNLTEVTWNTRAFESLVLDRKTKKLIQALISNQIEGEKSTDLISGKGNGLILLLHGGPGTGKTLTAESVAEIAQRPLYPVTCGDIGTEPEAVEKYLESVLHLGKTWGCVVLLDEADVFLEQRSLEDLRRNALVSVFLRVLEYYEGILVLTSNRVGTFDEAFKSRIQLAIHYNSLRPFQRMQIWGNFIRRLKELNEDGIDFDDLKDHIEQLAQNRMNGREIRNVITTARQYARWERQQRANPDTYQLNYEVMKEVIETSGKFDRYIEKLNGGLTHDQIAEDEGVRLAAE
ncbi:hypothetical protein F4780DRAFT_753660 [Xylariomycetidae sp. FL0641]|nr:hypothetical protein F4780DRAFT_753660 [Xylariomycetidae sp. FL0641]